MSDSLVGRTQDQDEQPPDNLLTYLDDIKWIVSQGGKAIYLPRNFLSLPPSYFVSWFCQKIPGNMDVAMCLVYSIDDTQGILMAEQTKDPKMVALCCMSTSC